jgi:transglutaminase-like putative cysteine protease
MDRRDFLRHAGAVSAGLALSSRSSDLLASGLAGAHAREQALPPVAGSAKWRTFEITTRIEVLQPVGKTRVWLPTPLTVATVYQKPLGNTFNVEGGTATTANDPDAANGIACIEFPEGVKPVAFLTCRAMTTDHAVDLTQPRPLPKTARADLQIFLKPTPLVPTDGIVKETATKIVAAAKAREDIDKARAIYDWVVEHTYRDPKVRGCGVGDIRALLESGNYGGKCADLNALFVGLARAAGLPARHIYGLRVAKSDRGFASLGPSNGICTKGQHCRAEVYLTRYGWVPVDPADVRKVMLEEPPGNLTADHDAVKRARAMLFGAWEMNWVGFNFGHDVVLPGSSRRPVGYFMYPQGETSEGRLDPFDPDNFKYEITSREIT